MQSDYHNLPIINGQSEHNGIQYHSMNPSVDKKRFSFSVDIAQAYPKEAAVERWTRAYCAAKQTIGDYRRLPT